MKKRGGLEMPQINLVHFIVLLRSSQFAFREISNDEIDPGNGQESGGGVRKPEVNDFHPLPCLYLPKASVSPALC